MMIVKSGRYYIRHALSMVKNNTSLTVWYNMENCEILQNLRRGQEVMYHCQDFVLIRLAN